MKENEFPVLKITNIDWDKDHEEYEKLPKNLELQWGSKVWSIDEVSNWISVNSSMTMPTKITLINQ